MRKTLIYLFCFVVLIIILSYCDGKSTAPTIPELPKPRANIKVEVAEWPLPINWTYWNWGWNYIEINVKVIVSESNGVGGRISTIKVQLFKKDVFITEETSEGGTFAAFGSYSESFWLKVYGPDYEVDELIVIAEGGDDNGYSFKETFSSPLSWGEDSLKGIK